MTAGCRSETASRVPAATRRVEDAAGDVKATRQHDWSPATSVRTGVEVARSGGGYPARAALMLELYKGPSPYGQFFQDDIKYIGIGLHLGF